MILGIDASNVRTGGGLTHLTRLLEVATPERYGFDEVIVWANRRTLSHLPSHPWLTAIHEPLLDRSLPHRLYWQWFRLPRLFRDRCDIIFSPGGNAPPGVSPIVTMSRNMLPFERHELFRYGFALITLRLLLLRYGQSRTFRRADGLIFLTEFARDVVGRSVAERGKVTIIPHGVEIRFRRPPRRQRPISECSNEDPFRLLYVSIIDVYKHQWHVAEAVSRLRAAGHPVVLDFVGPSYPAALARFRACVQKLDPDGSFLRYHGAIPFDELHSMHAKAELFVFASSCENMPNILLESMTAGFPIACSNRGPMPEILRDGGIYFDPENPAEIFAAIEKLLLDPKLRAECADKAFEGAGQYAWERCARETFEFISLVAREADRDRAPPASEP